MDVSVKLKPQDLILLGDVYLENAGLIDLPGHIVFNHEYVISSASDTPYPNKVNLLSRDNYLPSTFPKAEKLYANLTNNHTMDFGVEAFQRTVDLLQKSNVYCFGDHFDQSKTTQTLDGHRFSLLGYNMTRPHDMTPPRNIMKADQVIRLMEDDIPNAKKKGAKKVIVSLHYGDEHEPRPNKDQQIVSKAAIDLGADIIIGHHAHCIQNIEIYKEKPIFYSVGNTWFLRHSTPSYFDANGRVNRVFRARQTSWNTNSLVVIYNIASGDYQIKKASSKNGEFRLLNDTTIEEVNNYCNKWPKYTGHFRRYYLFAKSNMFIDGKIIDIDSFRHKFFEKKEELNKSAIEKQTKA